MADEDGPLPDATKPLGGNYPLNQVRGRHDHMRPSSAVRGGSSSGRSRQAQPLRGGRRSGQAASRAAEE